MISSCTNVLFDKQVLTFELREVSGITALSDNLLAMVQDEKGIIYIYDLDKGQVVNKLHFNDDGDYEDIELFNGVFYVLQSNGTIDKVSKAGQLLGQILAPHLSIENDTEGLCYSESHNSLLVLCKEKAGKGFGKNSKAIYSVDLEKGKYSEQPVIIIDRADFLDKKKRKKFKPSGLIVNTNNELVLIDSKSSILATFSIQGNYISHTRLDLPQPEGICIMPNSDVWVASEGIENGVLVRVEYKSH